MDSSDGEMHGEKAMIYLRTGGDEETVELSLTQTPENIREEPQKKVQVPESNLESESKATTTSMVLDIRTPYYDENGLQTVISWLYSEHCSKSGAEYTVRLVFPMILRLLDILDTSHDMVYR